MDRCLDCGEVNSFLMTYAGTPNPLIFPLSSSFLDSFRSYIPLYHFDMSKNELAIQIERCNANLWQKVNSYLHTPPANCDSIHRYNNPISPKQSPINECAISPFCCLK